MSGRNWRRRREYKRWMEEENEEMVETAPEGRGGRKYKKYNENYKKKEGN